MVSSDCSQIGTGSSNSPRSGGESASLSNPWEEFRIECEHVGDITAAFGKSPDFSTHSDFLVATAVCVANLGRHSEIFARYSVKIARQSP
jgi:hypothetical protein